MALSEDDLICDFAETYHILDYKVLSPSLAATLCVGLPDHSRIKKRMVGAKLGLTDMLLAMIVDGINLRVWQNSKDGMKGRNKPESLLKRLTEDKKPDDDIQALDIDDYEAWYQAKMRKYNG